MVLLTEGSTSLGMGQLKVARLGSSEDQLTKVLTRLGMGRSIEELGSTSSTNWLEQLREEL